MAFRKALAALPVWLAEPGDNIVAPDVDPKWLAATGLGVGQYYKEGTPSPWGWSADAVRQFKALGCQGPFPDVEKLRQLSHRRTAQLLYDALVKAGEIHLPYARPLELRDINDLPDTDRIVMKSPWSCSGRGVICCEGMSRAAIERRTADTIRRQGSVMIEPLLPKVRDFAMLFEIRGGKAIYRGLSLFFNVTATAYGGNIVAPEEELAAELGVDRLPEIADTVGSALSEIIGADYEGPVGVDMMIYGKERAVCPTVEVNLRYTMGFVALALRKRFGRGLFTVTPTGAIFRHPDGRTTALTP